MGLYDDLVSSKYYGKCNDAYRSSVKYLQDMIHAEINNQKVATATADWIDDKMYDLRIGNLVAFACVVILLYQGDKPDPDEIDETMIKIGSNFYNSPIIQGYHKE